MQISINRIFSSLNLKKILLMLAPLFLVIGGIANACVLTSTHYFDGGAAYNIASSNPVGASSDIGYDNPYTCSTSFSSAWSMIANASSGKDIYAQTGWTKDPGQSVPYQFTAWNPGDGTERIAYYNQVDGAAHNYAVADYDRTGSYGGFIYFQIDGVNIGQVYWNNVFVGNPCDSVQYFGEIPYADTQMPGTSWSPVYFTRVQYLHWDGGTGYNWGTPYMDPNNAWSTGDSTSRLNNSNYQNGEFDIWDTAPAAQ